MRPTSGRRSPRRGEGPAREGLRQPGGAFFLAEQGTPGGIVEHESTDAMFDNPRDPRDPRDPRTTDYVNGRFG
ncbi:hypothetical protein GFH48_16315 [Streptomyces fagopyri]|uniref:Uncharacterized protein n=1 Tax=Streptomyces fagopyri TaxID=2662397 RepID=A0A5Q0LCH5_9ACTN|nr:hypothetical protein [Streptomyces fagopyri]QFZ74621.1 hypothetical protein GFH48_16315 [Streptomyces fagopyri]